MPVELVFVVADYWVGERCGEETDIAWGGSFDHVGDELIFIVEAR